MAVNPVLDGCVVRVPPRDACFRASDAAQRLALFTAEIMRPWFEAQCAGLVSIVTHGKPVVTPGISLAAFWIEDFSPEGLQAQGGGTRTDMPGWTGSTIAAQLWIAGFPQTVSDGQDLFDPSPEQIHLASVLLASMGETWQAGLCDFTSREGPCSSWAVQAMTPLGPDDGMAGWETGFSLVL